MHSAGRVAMVVEIRRWPNLRVNITQIAKAAEDDNTLRSVLPSWVVRHHDLRR